MSQQQQQQQQQTYINNETPSKAYLTGGSNYNYVGYYATVPTTPMGSSMNKRVQSNAKIQDPGNGLYYG